MTRRECAFVAMAVVASLTTLTSLSHAFTQRPDHPHCSAIKLNTPARDEDPIVFDTEGNEYLREDRLDALPAVCVPHLRAELPLAPQALSGRQLSTAASSATSNVPFCSPGPEASEFIVNDNYGISCLCPNGYQTSVHGCCKGKGSKDREWWQWFGETETTCDESFRPVCLNPQMTARQNGNMMTCRF